MTVNSIDSIVSFLFYIITYSITILKPFLILHAYIIKYNNYKDIQYIREIKAKFNHNNVLTFSLALCLFSIINLIKM